VNVFLLSCSLLLLSVFYAWRYARTTIDPDFAMFNLAAFSGSIYGRDFADCKMPTIHAWYWLLAKIVGVDIWRVRCLHTVLVSLPGVAFYLLTGNFWSALAFIVFVNSGFLYAFHGNVGQQAAGLILLALVIQNGWVAVFLLAIAVAFEPKLAPAIVLLIVLKEWYAPAIALAICAGLMILFLRMVLPKVWGWLVEANITIPKRMTKRRLRDWSWDVIVPYYTSTGFLYSFPWLAAGMIYNPDWRYWLPPLVFVAFLFLGVAVRSIHMLPLAGWVAAAGIAPLAVIVLVLVDWLSSAFYFGDLWLRFYPGLRAMNSQAREVGEYLRDKPGTLWVADIHSAVYIYARKKVQYGLAEQIEIRENAYERRAVMLEGWKKNPPDWVVTGPEMEVKFKGDGYKNVANCGNMGIWKMA
jgi:hypothetical protein